MAVLIRGLPLHTRPGGGSGGSVRIITEGNFTNNGQIEANGGKGQDGGEKSNNCGGGGGGGRVAVFYRRYMQSCRWGPD